MHSYFLKLPAAPLEPWLLDFVSPDRRNRILSMRQPTAQQLSLCASLFVRMQISSALSCPPDQLQLNQTPNGKPHLACQPDPPLFFSLSHTAGAVLLTLSRTGDVGCDLESLSRPIAPRALQKLWHPLECACFEAAAPENKSELFYTIWTRKEAYGKCNGRGLLQDLTNLHTLSSEPAGFFSWQTQGYLCTAFQPGCSTHQWSSLCPEELLAFYQAQDR